MSFRYSKTILKEIRRSAKSGNNGAVYWRNVGKLVRFFVDFVLLRIFKKWSRIPEWLKICQAVLFDLLFNLRRNILASETRFIPYFQAPITWCYRLVTLEGRKAWKRDFVANLNVCWQWGHNWRSYSRTIIGVKFQNLYF